MSRWLQNVNSLLEKLDDRAETVAEEIAVAKDEQEGNTGDGGAAIDDILAKRGLAVEEDEQDEENVQGDSKELLSGEEEAMIVDREEHVVDTSVQETSETISPALQVEGERTDTIAAADTVRPQISEASSNASVSKGSEADDGKIEQHVSGKDNQFIPAPPPPPSPMPPTSDSSQKQDPSPPPPPVANKQSTVSKPPPPNPSNNVKSQKDKQKITLELKEAQKESRTLRRHVVSLNAQLEAAERELQAQRKELDGVADRLEKDRKRVKDEKEALQKKLASELANQKTQQEQTLKEQKQNYEDQLQSIKTRLEEVENRRKQEGGDWNKEMVQAVGREQEMIKRNAILE